MRVKYKVLIINGSPRKKRTFMILSKLNDIFQREEIDTEIINIRDYTIKTCRGCEVCITRGNCVLKDDVQLLKQKMIESNGIVFGSPVYMRHVSGGVKNFIDRTCSWYHRPELVGKVLLPVATTAGFALYQTLDYLDQVAYQWGMLSVKGLEERLVL